MDSSTAGPSGMRVITRSHLYNIMKNHVGDMTAKLNYLENYLLSRDSISEEQEKQLKRKISNLKFEFKKRWSDAHRKDDLFKKQNEDWLQGCFELPTSIIRSGRPTKPFNDLCERSKRRKTQGIRENVVTEELQFATQMKLKESGKAAASKILSDITQSPTRALKYRKAYTDNLQKKIEKMSTIQALSIFVEADLSRKQYEIIASSAKKVFPCYSLLQKAKKKCYPSPESYTVTNTLAEINLQDLLDHTATRLLIYLKDVLEALNVNEYTTLELLSKWGCDGSQQTQYKQKFDNSTESDTNIFQSSLVPLRLICSRDDKKIIWQNPTPSSPRYCRPIRINFTTETTEVIKNEINYIKTKIDSLNNTKFESNSNIIEVKHTLAFTMVDAKVCNAATDTKSTMRCYICGASSKEFNDLSKIKKADFDENALQFGLSILHARIRLFESILHLAYKLPVKKWQLRSEEDKDLVKKRKTEIQEEFRKQLGLIIDVPKVKFGNTNDGNTSRRFFNNVELAAEITGINVHYIYRMKIILQTISSGYKIDTQKFENYTMETAKLYVELYSWHPMTPTLHKILLHGKIVIEKALLPIGQLSEEAAEARNKHFRLFRLNYARKFSRIDCNMDVLNRLLLTSDPLVTSMRRVPRKKTSAFDKETLEMLISESPITITQNDNNMIYSESEDEEEGDKEGEDKEEGDTEDEDEEVGDTEGEDEEERVKEDEEEDTTDEG